MKNEFLSKVYRWFSLGLLITFLTAYYVSTNLNLLSLVFSGSGYWIIILLEFGLAIFLTARIRSMSTTTASICYVGYSFLTGLTFSAFFVLYEITSIIYIFLASSIVFFLFSLLGKSKKLDLSNYGLYLGFSLIGLIILELINWIFLNNTLNIIASIIGLGIFVAYVAYDTHKILKSYDETDNMAIMGALQLYLDFINIFIRLLELFGKARKD